MNEFVRVLFDTAWMIVGMTCVVVAAWVCGAFMIAFFRWCREKRWRR